MRPDVEDEESWVPLSVFEAGEYWQVVELFAGAWVDEERSLFLEVAWFVPDHEKPPVVLECAGGVWKYVATYAADVSC